MKKLTLITILLINFATLMFAQENQTKAVVAIAGFDVKGVSEDEANVLFEVFISEFAGLGKCKVVDRSSVDKIKAQHNFQNSDWSNSDKVAQLGNALNASLVITGQLMDFKGSLVATFRMLDVNTMEIVATATERTNGTDQLFEKLGDMATKLAKNLNGSSSSVKTSYNIGDEGPGGGIIFLKDGDWRWELSDDFGKYNWNTAREFTVDYNGFSDWRLPDLEEMAFVYNNLVEYGLILNKGTFCAANGGNDYYAFS